MRKSKEKLSSASYQIRLNVTDYTSVLLATIVVFVLTHLGLYSYNYQVAEIHWLLIQIFDLDDEHNLPTWFSSFLLLNCSFFLLLKACSNRVELEFYWWLLAAGFLVLAIDEVAGIHESFNSATEILWAIPAAIMLAFVAVAFVPFLLKLRRNLAGMFILSGFTFVSGAIIVEILSVDMDSDSQGYALATALEEGLEMLGAWLFIRTMMRELSDGTSVDAVVSIEN